MKIKDVIQEAGFRTRFNQAAQRGVNALGQAGKTVGKAVGNAALATGKAVGNAALATGKAAGGGAVRALGGGQVLDQLAQNKKLAKQGSQAIKDLAATASHLANWEKKHGATDHTKAFTVKSAQPFVAQLNRDPQKEFEKDQNGDWRLIGDPGMELPGLYTDALDQLEAKTLHTATPPAPVTAPVTSPAAGPWVTTNAGVQIRPATTQNGRQMPTIARYQKAQFVLGNDDKWTAMNGKPVNPTMAQFLNDELASL